jgi:hypothetical protein
LALAETETDTAATDDELVAETKTTDTNPTPYVANNDQDTGEVLGAADDKSWAMANLILAGATVLMSVVVALGFFGKDKDEQRHGVLRALTLIPAAGAVAAFLLTEDWTLPTAFVDVWSILMVAILAVGVVLTVFAVRGGEKG